MKTKARAHSQREMIGAKREQERVTNTVITKWRREMKQANCHGDYSVLTIGNGKRVGGGYPVSFTELVSGDRVLYYIQKGPRGSADTETGTRNSGRRNNDYQ